MFAFPSSGSQRGMSLRDYFAAHCPSDLAKCNVSSDCEKITGAPWPSDDRWSDQIAWNNKVEAFLRCAYADAMMKERDCGTKPAK